MKNLMCVIVKHSHELNPAVIFTFVWSIVRRFLLHIVCYTCSFFSFVYSSQDMQCVCVGFVHNILNIPIHCCSPHFHHNTNQMILIVRKKKFRKKEASGRLTVIVAELWQELTSLRQGVLRQCLCSHLFQIWKQSIVLLSKL